MLVRSGWRALPALKDNPDRRAGAPAWALVDADGIVLRAHGVVLTPTHDPGAGGYRIRVGTGTPPAVVGTDISNCTYVGTLIGRPTGEIVVEASLIANDTLFVFTANSAGVLVNHEFSVAVFC